MRRTPSPRPSVTGHAPPGERVPEAVRGMLAGLLSLALAWGVASPATGQERERSCPDDFEALVSVVRADYAGYRHKARKGADRLAALKDSVRGVVSSATDPADCTEALRRWVAFFGDPHLRLSERRPERVPSPEGVSDEGPSEEGASEGPGRDAEPAEDPGQPSIRFPDDSTAVLALPDFGDRFASTIDSLVAVHRARLYATPYLVVDVRGNAGGWTGSYESVIPLLYTGPILVHGMEFRASDGNIAYLRRLLASDRAEGIKRKIRAFLPEAEAGRGGFVTLADDRTIVLDTVRPMPRSVAVLVGRGCASTCEQFVLEARQSDKVTVVGTDNTGGFLDYGNGKLVRLPSGRRSVRVPTARSTRLPENPLDGVGIAPEVRIPGDHPDPVGFARRYVRSLPGPARSTGPGAGPPGGTAASSGAHPGESRGSTR